MKKITEKNTILAGELDAATLTPSEATLTPSEATTATLPPPFDAVNCPVRQVLDRFGDKWSILVIILLGDRGKLRFNELSNAVGDISQKMLTVTLRSLEADGLVTRKMYPEIPPRVEYELTGMARSLLPLIKEMVKWADANIDEIQENRRRHAERAPSPGPSPLKP